MVVAPEYKSTCLIELALAATFGRKRAPCGRKDCATDRAITIAIGELSFKEEAEPIKREEQNLPALVVVSSCTRYKNGNFSLGSFELRNLISA